MYVLVRESSRTLIFFTEVAFMKLFRFVSWSLLALGMTGCVSSDTLIKLNPDGSGTVIQKTLMNVEMLAQMNAMMQGIAKQTGAFESGKDSTVPELFSESQIRRMAAKMGEGVTFVSSRKIKAEQVEGFEATYAFKDITKLRISQKLGPPGPNEPGTAPDDDGEKTMFRFAKLPNGHSLLTTIFPQGKADLGKAPSSPPQESGGQPAPAEIERMKRLVKGLRIGMAVEIQGSLVQTNSPYVEGAKVTLLEMDFSELLSNEAKLKEMAALKSYSLEDAKKILKDLKGFKINLEPELRIEFAPR